MQQAIDDGLVCEENVERVESNATGSNRGQNVAGLAEAGFNIVVANGFLFSTEILGTVADFPDVDFAVTDGFTSFLFDDPETEDVEPIPPNIADLTFKEHEGSFLVGAAAAIACDCDTIGFLGGQTDAPLIQKFEAGYVAGAQYINPDMEVLVEYVDPDPAIGFNDAVKGEALSTKMYENGAELIYHAAGGVGRRTLQRRRQGEQARDRRGLRSVPHGFGGAAAVDPHVDAEARGRRRVQRDQGKP